LNNVKVNNEGENALKDVAPTILHLLGIEQPSAFTGHSIFI
jgi:bisphosphoglycerate-independent phosphoglycerate mutase (AlkP superfamily)